MIRLSKTGIEYGDYAWNFASGCDNQVDGICKSGNFKCWAYSISQRFKAHYPNSFKPTIYPESLCSPIRLKKPSRIFCAFMGDLFGDCPEFDPSYCGSPKGQFGEDEHGLFTLKGRLFDTIEKCPQHTFVFLTKQQQNLIKFSPFPDNCIVGATVTHDRDMIAVAYAFDRIVAKTRFISFEPLLERMSALSIKLIRDFICQWVIIGACTGTKAEMEALIKRYPELTLMPYGKKWTAQPPISWVQEIVQAADKAGIPVFLKNNLKPLIEAQLMCNCQWAAKEWVMCKYPVLRQGFPSV